MSNYNTLKTADTINAVSIVDGAITTSKLNNSVTTLIVSGGGPKATAITYPGNDLAADTAGGQTITVTGTGFVAGCSVFIGTTQASVVTVVSATSVTFTTPALAAATYTLYLVNPDGGTATIVPGISYSGTPTWTTGAGSLASIYEYSAINNTITATGDGSIVYSVFSGTLPTGSSLNTTTGVITGTSPASAGATTYTFVIRATDAQLQDTDRTFSITINTDAVTWTTPAANSTVTLGQSLASTTTLLATSAASNAITYTANTLPTGMSISGATVTGTPTVVGNTTSTFTATAATTNRTATAIINWTVSVSGDTYFPYTTLLLSGGTSTSTFIADASTNNFAVTIVGDTKPNNFNPYTPGYYSNYFDGTGDYLNLASQTAFGMGAGDFTVESWVLPTAYSGGDLNTIFDFRAGGGQSSFALFYNSSYLLQAFDGPSNTMLGSATLQTNAWNHVALTRSGTTWTLWLNGVSQGTRTSANNLGSSQPVYIGTAADSPGASRNFIGYQSNFRVVKGTAVYTGTFTPPTAPLTATQSSGTNISAITGTATSLLTCQSNRFIDNSTNAFAITKYGNTTVSPTTPFVPNTAYAAYGSTYFDGTGDYLAASNTAAQFGSSNWTVEGWVYLNSIGSVYHVLANYGYTSETTRSWIIYIDLGGTLHLAQSTNGSANFDAGFGTPTFIANTWTYVAVVRNGATITAYQNGVALSSTQTAQNLFASSAAFTIGSDLTNYLSGYFSDLRIVKGTAVYTSAFTPPSTPLTAITNTSLLTCQTNQPVNNNVFLDSSTNALAVTRVGNTSAGTFSPYGANWSNYFDGSSGKVSIPYNANYVLGTNDFTVECWVMFNDISAPLRNLVSLGYGANGDGPVTSTWALNYLGSAGSNQLRFYRYTGSTETYYTTSGFSPSNGVWYHIAFSRTGGNLRIFGNGVALYSGANSINYTAINTSDPLLVGLGYFGPQLGMNGPRYFNGYISNLRVINGTGIYSSGFTPPTAPLTAVTNTKLLACQSNRYVDNSSIGATVTPGGNTTIQRFSPFSPSAAYTAGTTGGSAYFDGTGDYLTTPSSSLFNLNGINWTVEGWFNLVSATSDDRLFVFAGASVSWGFYRRAATGNIYFGQMGSDEALLGNMLLNEWTHLALVRTSGPTISLYKNGVFSASTAAYSMPNENCTFLIAGNPAPYANTVTKGYVSDVRVVKGTALYTTTFTPPTAPLTAVTNTSLLLNMTSAGIVDATMINSLETVGDAKRVLTQTPYAGSYYSNYFDGTGDYLTVATNAVFNFGTGDFTLEAWIYRTGTSGLDAFIISASGTGGLFWGILSNGDLGWGRAGVAWDYQFASGMVINTWYHVALTRSGTSMKMFINGVQLGVTQTLATSYNISTTSLNIGSQGATYYFTGYISNARIVKDVAVYTGNFAVPTAPLTATQVAGTNIAAVTGTATSLLTCQSNSLVDNSTNAFAVTRTGDTSVQSFNPFQRNSGSSMLFSGSSGSNPTTRVRGYGPVYNLNAANFTVEMWYYPTAHNSTGYPILYTSYETWVSGNVYNGLIGLLAGNQNYAVGSKNKVYLSLGDNYWYGTTTVPPLNTWTHIALVRDVNRFMIFINGTMEVDTTQAAGTMTNNQLAVVGGGTDAAGLNCITGYINDFRITKGYARYTATFTPPTTAFIAR